MKYITYIIYCVLMYSLTFLPFFYVIFWKDASPWWFILAATMANCVISPTGWGLTEQTKSTTNGSE
jgi:hypothetical protein